jgi:hypothetical protein
MKVLLLLSLPVLAVLLFFFPRTVSVLACLPWANFVVAELTNRLSFSQTVADMGAEESPFTQGELQMLARYAFFFRAPYAAMDISSASSIWMVATVPWAILLGFHGAWLFLLCPLFVLLAALYLVARLNPVLFLSEAARRNPTLLPIPSNEAATFLIFVELCKKGLMADSPIQRHLHELVCGIWPDGILAKQRSWP